MSFDDQLKALLQNSVRSGGGYGPDARKPNPHNFLMTVAKVQQDQSDQTVYQVAGRRQDTNEHVIVRVKKQNYNQFIPQPGGVMRADGVAVDTSRAPSGQWKFYTANFFRSYAPDDLCIHAYAMPTPPRYRQEVNMTTAQVHCFDIDAAVTDAAPNMLKDNRLIAEIMRAMKPWAAEQKTRITHDAKGHAIWSGAVKPGITPMAYVRVGTHATMRIYGRAFEREGETFRRPTDQEILNKLMQSKPMQTLQELAKVQNDPHMRTIPITVYPAMAVEVGRDSLKGDEMGHIRFRDNYEWVDRNDPSSDGGQPVTKFGARMSFVHAKTTRNGNLIALDLFRDDSHPYIGQLPDTELARSLNAEHRAMQQSVQPHGAAPVQRSVQQAPHQPVQQAGQAPVQERAQGVVGMQPSRQPLQTPAPQQAVHAPNQSVSESPAQAQATDFYPEVEPEDIPFDPNDYEAFAADLEAMEQMNAGFEPVHDPELDDLLREAENKQKRRYAMPRM